MLNAMTVPAPLDAYAALRGLGPVPATRRAPFGEVTRARLLARYLEGWAEADPAKIAAATGPGYRFDDPFVGTFSTLALRRYFEALRFRTGLGAPTPRQQLSFQLRGPMHAPSERGALEFWRECPRLGLTGTSLITLTAGGVISERVAYDLNMAAEQLRGRSARLSHSPSDRRGRQQAPPRRLVRPQRRIC